MGSWDVLSSMTEFRGAWDEDDVAQFLREATIPIRLCARRPNGSHWLVALWYRYRDGRLECATGAEADLVGFLRRNPEVAFDVSTNRIPYRGVRGSGTVTLAPDTEKTVLRSLLDRYVGRTDTPLGRELLRDGRDEVCITIDPEDVYSWDFSSRMQTEEE